ncbi:unnamed protein product [Cylicocyclus nassatus]|uniref:VWFA domain-containing protein n=1 Tax=Cylicocyclus nassatus TaxID=53992 RepID=A0AA36GRU9_CYLNA|nr:unnamed protein product [Cylicocyclus nassatus]
MTTETTDGCPPICRPVALRLNVVFLLDGSGSVSGATFDMQMKMLNKITNMMDIGKNDSQIAVLQYAGYTKLEIDFNENQDPDKLLNSLRNIRHMSGTTKTGKAMFKALELFEKAKQTNGQDALKVAVIVTDGHSNDNPLPAAKALRDAGKVFRQTDVVGVTILTLGIGDHINRDEIVRISGKDELAFQELHREMSLRNFISGFKNLSQGEHCDYARGSNGVQITCGPDYIQAEVSTTKRLEGRFYFGGFHADPDCFASDNSIKLDLQHEYYNAKIKSPFGKCGLVKSYQSSTDFVISGRVLLQFDGHFASARDPSFEIRCFYNESVKASKGFAQAESDVQDQSLVNEEKIAADSTKHTKCRYEVIPQTPTCSTAGINVGTQLLHRWTCDHAHKRFFVHSCVIMDPTSQRSRLILDSQGCTLDKSVISNILYFNNGTATSVGNAVRFADSPVTRYSCHLRLFKRQDELSSIKNRCRNKRQVNFEHNSDPGFVELAEESLAYHDEMEKLLPDLGEVILDLAKERMSTVTTTTQQSKTFPLRSITSFFPYGGIDVPLTSKSVTIVKTEQAKNHYRQALRLRTKAPKSISAHTGRSSLRELNVVGDDARHAGSFLESHPMRQVTSTAELTNKKEQIAINVANRTKRTRMIRRIRTSAAPHITTITVRPASVQEKRTQENAKGDTHVEEVVVTSELLVVRLPHQNFVSGCLEGSQCSK